MSRWVYFAEGPIPNLIKIGISHNPAKRIATLGCSPIGVIHERELSESAAHELFSPSHVKGEWFSLHPETVVAVLSLEGHKLSPVESTVDEASKYGACIGTKLDKETLDRLSEIAAATGLKTADLLRIGLRKLIENYAVSGKLEVGKEAA